MSIKVNPFKNNIGASISCNLKSLEPKKYLPNQRSS